jgi:hypothetical protein
VNQSLMVFDAGLLAGAMNSWHERCALPTMVHIILAKGVHDVDVQRVCHALAIPEHGFGRMQGRG